MVPDDLGWATVRYQCNKKPRCILEAYYDAEDHLCLNRDGYAMIRQKWDGNGRRLWREYYDAEEKPITGPEGYFREENKYDHMKLDHTSRYDTEGNLVKGDGVWAVTQYEYDSRRRCTKAEYLDAVNRAIALSPQDQRLQNNRRLMEQGLPDAPRDSGADGQN